MVLHPAAWVILFLVAAAVVWFTVRED